MVCALGRRMDGVEAIEPTDLREGSDWMDGIVGMEDKGGITDGGLGRGMVGGADGRVPIKVVREGVFKHDLVGEDNDFSERYGIVEMVR